MRSWCWTICGFLALTTRGSSTVLAENTNGFTRRRLEDGNGDFEYMLSNFSLRFDRCQHVKMFNDDLAADEDSDSPLAVKHFVVYRLCPSNNCQECDGIYGTYVTEIDDYLQYTVAEQQKYYENMCQNCEEQCDADGDDCTGCGKTCAEYQNLEAMGYIDAANFIQCQKLEVDGGNRNRQLEDGQEENQLYIGPRCSRNGSKILIGLFSDEDCLDPYSSEDPEDYLGGQLSYHMLSHTSSDDGSYCLSCKENEADGNQEDQADGDNVNEMCEDLYGMSGKCESKTGLYGFIDENRADGDYENQVETEFMVCNFIESLLLDSYTESGDVNLEGDFEIVIREMTGLQKITMSVLSLTIVGLVMAAFFLHRKFENSYPKVDLAVQGEATLA